MHGLPEYALDRRALMRGAILLVGGVAAAGIPDIAFAQETAAATPAFFSAEERAILDAFCGTMIPKTDTPGAIEAGVPAFIDAMMTNWAANRTRRQFKTALTAIDAAATAAKGKGFAALTPSERLEVLTAHDAASVPKDPAYRRLKELTLTGYYLSEPGATVELRYELAPGSWEGKVPVTAETRAWAVG